MAACKSTGENLPFSSGINSNVTKKYHISRGKEIKRKHVLPCNSGDLSHIPVAYERKINVAILFFHKFIKAILSHIIMRTLRELPVLPWKPDIHLSCDAGKLDWCVSRLQLTVNYEMLMLAYRLSYFLSAGQSFFCLSLLAATFIVC